MRKLYLAYGSNLNKEQMMYRCPDAMPVSACLLLNYALVFRRGYLTIEPKTGSTVPAAIWEISSDDEKRLDRYEGFPRFYFKKTLRLKMGEGLRNAMVYIMADGHPIQAPTDFYLQTVKRGYADFGLNREALADAYGRALFDGMPQKD